MRIVHDVKIWWDVRYFKEQQQGNYEEENCLRNQDEKPGGDILRNFDEEQETKKCEDKKL